MKVIFFLDRTDENGNIVESNIRALEATPDQLQLRQTGPNETWLAFPVGNEGKFIPLVKFPIALKTDEAPSAEPSGIKPATETLTPITPAAPVPLGSAPTLPSEAPAPPVLTVPAKKTRAKKPPVSQ